LDSVRVIENEDIHPCEINFNDNLDIVFNLFKLVNFITIKMISKPKEIELIYKKGIKSKDEKEHN